MVQLNNDSLLANTSCIRGWDIKSTFLEHPYVFLILLVFLISSNILTWILRCYKGSLQDINININHILNMYTVEFLNRMVITMVR